VQYLEKFVGPGIPLVVEEEVAVVGLFGWRDPGDQVQRDSTVGHP
jgi:hypothetical protein